MSVGRVAVARRGLFEDRRRAALTTTAVAAALLLVLLLQGIFDGAMREVTAYLRSSPADVIVSQRGVRTMHMSVSTLDSDTAAKASQVDSVAWAEAIGFTATFIVSDAGAKQQLSYIIGYDTATGRAGPRSFSAGAAPRSREIALEEVGADRLGVGIGDDVTVFGTPFRVAGLFRGGTTIANSLAFITADDFVRLRGDRVAYAFVGGEPGVTADQLADRLRAALPNETIQTRAQFAHQEAALVKDMSADLMRIISVVGLLIALAVVGLTLFALTLAKLREHAILKALGGRNRRLVAVVVGQAVWSVGVALAVATAAAILLGRLVHRIQPAVAVTITANSVLRVAVAGLVIGVFGALAPLRRVAAIDAASAFRRLS